MSPPIRFCPVSENIALATQPVAELLGEDFKVLTYTIRFNEGSARDFALGFSKASPMDCYDYDDPEEVVTFLELDPDEPKELKPPYAPKTIMYVNLWRIPKKLNYVYIAIKVGNFRSGTYASSCHAYQDYLAIRCKPALVIGGFINVMTTEEYLEQRHDSSDHNKCVVCCENQAEVYFTNCGHVAYCAGCAPSAYKHDGKCPNCHDMNGCDVAKNRIAVKSLYCVNCVHKRCDNLNTLNLPCGCLLSCAESAQTTINDQCQYCEKAVEETKKVYMP